MLKGWAIVHVTDGPPARSPHSPWHLFGGFSRTGCQSENFGQSWPRSDRHAQTIAPIRHRVDVSFIPTSSLRVPPHTSSPTKQQSNKHWANVFSSSMVFPPALFFTNGLRPREVLLEPPPTPTVKTYACRRLPPNLQDSSFCQLNQAAGCDTRAGRPSCTSLGSRTYRPSSHRLR